MGFVADVSILWYPKGRNLSLIVYLRAKVTQSILYFLLYYFLLLYQINRVLRIIINKENLIV